MSRRRGSLGDVRLALVGGLLLLGCGPAAVPRPYPGDNSGALIADNPACGPGNTCAPGSACVILVRADGDHRVCLSGEVCALLQCPAEWTCLAQASLPARVFCAYFEEP